MSGYVELPAGWERVSTSGPGPFVTREVLRGPGGEEVRWHSRAHRKAHSTHAGEEGVWWRPHRAGWWMAVLFSFGSLCFFLAAVAAQWASSPQKAIGVTFFVGSLFFTSAAYLQYAETVNVEHQLTSRQRHERWRPASWEPRRIDWLAASVQLLGTVFFNISTFAALKHGLSTRQVDHRVWGPDVFGSICFLISSELAFAEVCHTWIGFQLGSLSWRIVALNLLGSIAFGVAAIASLVEPTDGIELSTRINNAGTALGGLCFLIAAIALMPEASAEESSAATAIPLAGTASA